MSAISGLLDFKPRKIATAVNNPMSLAGMVSSTEIVSRAADNRQGKGKAKLFNCLKRHYQLLTSYAAMLCRE